MNGNAKMADKRIALLGSKGMLGSDFQNSLKSRAAEFDCFDLPGFDITDSGQIEDTLPDFDIIINAAAYTDVEKAEDQPEKAYAVNSEAVENIADFARKNNQYLIHFSTDFVFDGDKPYPYKEQDTPNPVNVYGKSKLEGENKIRQAGCKSCIIRIEWTYGTNGNNFAGKVIQKSREKQQLNIVDDQIGSPTPTRLISDMVCEIINKKPEGLFHYACSGYTSRFEMAKFIADQLNLDVKISPCKTSDYPTKAKRPLNSRFDCSKITEMTGKPIPDWQDCLKDYLEQL
jgi:dTDP-4-dehydrorhamnose reductase